MIVKKDLKLNDLKKKIKMLVKKFDNDEKKDILKSYNINYFDGMRISNEKVVETIIINLSDREIEELYKI